MTLNYKNSTYPRSFLCEEAKIEQRTPLKKDLCEIGEEAIWESRFTSFFKLNSWIKTQCMFMLGFFQLFRFLLFPFPFFPWVKFLVAFSTRLRRSLILFLRFISNTFNKCVISPADQSSVEARTNLLVISYRARNSSLHRLLKSELNICAPCLGTRISQRTSGQLSSDPSVFLSFKHFPSLLFTTRTFNSIQE